MKKKEYLNKDWVLIGYYSVLGLSIFDIILNIINCIMKNKCNFISIMIFLSSFVLVILSIIAIKEHNYPNGKLK